MICNQQDAGPNPADGFARNPPLGRSETMSGKDEKIITNIAKLAQEMTPEAKHDFLTFSEGMAAMKKIMDQKDKEEKEEKK